MRRLALVLVSIVPLASGCATATIEDAVPAGALQQPAQERVFSEPGQYPNLNVNPQPAAPQLTDAEIRAQTAALRARREQQADEARDRDVTDRSSELRRLASRHARDALAEIEGQ
jgi:hypothetical protein